MHHPEPQSFTLAWREAWRSRAFRLRLFATVAGLAAISTAFAYFVPFVEQRPGVVLADPFLERLPVLDLTWITFALIYCAMGVGLYALRADPDRVLLALGTWGGMLLVRTAAMYVTPLDPPRGMVPLVDPIAQLIFGATSAPTRDLFFSGHTSTMTVLFLTASGPRLRGAFLLATFGVATCVLLQRVHYTVDVLAAPFFVYGVYRLLAPAAQERRGGEQQK